MGSSSHGNGGDEPRVSKSATILLGELGSSGEGPGFCGYSELTHINKANYGLGFHKEPYLYQPRPEGKEGGLVDRINRNKGLQVALRFCSTQMKYLKSTNFLRLVLSFKQIWSLVCFHSLLSYCRVIPTHNLL